MPTGVIVNCIAILSGGIIGGFLGHHFPKYLKETLPKIFGLAAMAIGIKLIIELNSLPAVILALILGTVLGEVLKLETSLISGLKKIKSIDQSNSEYDLIVSAVVLFCFSGTGIFGTLQAGMAGDHTILFSKAVLDFFTSMIFGATAGYVIAFIALPQLLIGLALFFSSTLLIPILSSTMLNDFKALGGIITLAVGFKVAGIKTFRVLNMVPALILVLILSWVWTLLF
ncbi:MAG: DUF554 domain-containing protein [Clostridia bacterium]|nr:DUF554 domain-containing protein [Clostridia bacterium]